MMKAIRSTTTQNVAAGTVVGGGAALAVVVWARAQWPNLPGTPETDKAVALLVMTFLSPLMSRALAFFRHPSKNPSAASSVTFKCILVPLLCLGLVGGSLGGCATTTSPDGTVVTEFNVDDAIRVAEWIIQMEARGYAIWEKWQAAQDERDEAEQAAYEEERRDRLQALDDMRGRLRELYQKRLE